MQKKAPPVARRAPSPNGAPFTNLTYDVTVSSRLLVMMAIRRSVILDSGL